MKVIDIESNYINYKSLEGKGKLMTFKEKGNKAS